MGNSKESKYHLNTQLIHGTSNSPHWDYNHHVVPSLTRSSAFKLDSVTRGAKGFATFGSENPRESIYVYDRLGEPNTSLLEDSLAASEKGDVAITFATGMSAIQAALMFRLRAGDHILAHKTLYGCTYSLMTRWLSRLGIETTFVDLRDPENLTKFIKPNTRIVYLESPSNPSLELLDLPTITSLLTEINKGKEQKILSVIDNTFATPFAQRPIEHGVDLVVHSLTKGISGFGVTLGGVVVTRREFFEELLFFRKDFGATLSPESAWHVQVYGLSTLSLRMRAQQESAQKIAQYLEKHPLVERVTYPGLDSYPQSALAKKMLRDIDGNFAPGAMVYCVLKGKTLAQSSARGRLFMDLVAQDSYPITLAVSLGQIRTLIEHPSSMTHSAYPVEDQPAHGIDPGGIRVSVGLEQTSDIITDFERCLSYLPPL